jgi:hypothetical protein
MQDSLTLPSANQIGDQVWLNLWRESIATEVSAVHFYPGKVKYSLNVSVRGGGTTRLINIDSAFVSKIHPDHKS